MQNSWSSDITRCRNVHILSQCCQQTHGPPPDMQVDAQARTVRRKTLGQAARNEISISNLQAVNLPSCGFSSEGFYC